MGLRPTAQLAHYPCEGPDMSFPFLPDMWISTDADAPLFLRRLKDIARQLSQVGIEHQKQILTLVPTEPNIANFRIVLSSDKEQETRIFVNAEANGWREVNPDYEEYTALTRRFIGPVLKAYNKRYRSNRRLHVQTIAQLTPKLSQYPAKFFDDFTTNANKSFLSRTSWRHFYKFIICCHRRNEHVSWDEIEFLLRQAGFGEYYCEKLYMIFEHGWGILEELPDSKLKAWQRRMREQEIKRRQTRHGV